VERLDDIKRKFPSAVDLGAHSGHIRKHLGGRVRERDAPLVVALTRGRVPRAHRAA
jgi:hypothetical protein